jgi:hypothetical protein
MAKARCGAGRGNAREAGLRRVGDVRYTVDTPVPYRISDLIQTIDDRMGKLENKRDLSPYRNLKTRLEAISLGPHDADRRPHLPCAGQRQTDHHPRAYRSSHRDHQRSGIRALPSELRLRAVERGSGARDARLRGGAPLRALQHEPQLRALQAPSPRSPRRAASMVPRCALSPSDRPRSTDHPVAMQHHARSLPLATASRCRCASSSTNCPSTAYRAARRPASRRSGRSQWAMRASWKASSIVGAMHRRLRARNRPPGGAVCGSRKPAGGPDIVGRRPG